MTTGFFWDERSFWHGGGNYAGMLPVGGLVQPLDGGLPESPETKRRLKNLIEVTGLARDLEMRSADIATRADLLRVHPAHYLDEFKALSDAGGGELGRRTPFGPGGYELAALSAGIAKSALSAVLTGQLRNAYALSRPPGHHCLPDFPNGFCLFNNIGIAIEAARAAGQAKRFAVLDWDVHHGNGTEAVFYDRDDVLTVSIHQDRNYPMDTGAFVDRGTGAGTGFNLNIPLPPGTGHTGYLATMERLALPAIHSFAPDVLIIACGYDAAANDPLGRMLATADTFAQMTAQVMALADDVCGGKLLMVHEGGYSETYVPFCGHAVLQTMSGSDTSAPDPFAEVFPLRQPDAGFDAYLGGVIGAMVDAL
ncbi:class II histone deacetylase [Loktanella sp. D2R18]|uniref:class II histone deacetylase n=1 Tax=Rhodobacterales TaxID=204455 RepID=UPI000DEA3375|nr:MULTISPECIES: class II histone deacetylase [Rhodobacterales]MDO6589338.1 class II histone deacetylase [Yoonia sp. 1_MG-2023]RBW45247.1 class II histone deacetylase [Loktanella sp. D2R18]